MELAEADPRIGSVVDARYRILDALAAGSMGVVYRAERVPVGRAVAIKFLHAAFAQDPEFVGRFERETRVLSKLAHPHCVSVLDFGVTEGAPYIVMDFVAGITLWQVLEDEPFVEVMRSLTLTRQILAGLAHAHEQGIVHRDIKPANIMISEEIGTGPHVRILDFGLARLRGALNVNTTQTNVVVGTPSYMAPEQTVGNIVDARADIYATGVVLFEMITGEKPFRAEDTLALLGMHRAAPIPRLANLVPEGTDLPDGVQALIDRAMAKAPDARFQTAIEFATAIDDVLATRGMPRARRVSSAPIISPADSLAPTSVDIPRHRTDAEPAKRRGGAGFLFLLVLLLGGAAAGIWYVRKHDADGDRVASSTERDAAPPRRLGPTPPARARDASVAAVVPAVVPAVVIDAGAAAGSAVLDGGVAGAAVAGAGAGSGASDAAAAAVTPGLPASPSADAAVAVAVVTGSGAPAGADAIEAEPDPATADDPDPAAAVAVTQEDEAPDAPDQVPVDAKPAPTREPLATSVSAAVKLIEGGKRELALASLQALWPKQKASAYIPFLLGNLYYAKRWWSVAMEHYRTAISKNSAYKKNSTLNRNVIRMLASAKTIGKANYFLRKTIGKPARPYLTYCSKHDENATVKQRCAALAKVVR